METVKEISQNLDSVGWFLLFLGWTLYWFKQLDAVRRTDLRSFFSVPLKDFLLANTMEIPISAISCLVIAILAKDIPSDLLDLHGRISIFLAGYSSSSILNSILSYRKPATKEIIPANA